MRFSSSTSGGADFVQIQLVYDMQRFRKYLRRAVDIGVAQQLKIIVGVGPY